MRKIFVSSILIVFAAVAFGGAAMANKKSGYIPAASTQGSKLGKYSGLEKNDETQRNAFELASLLSIGYVASNSLTACSTGKTGFMDFDAYGVPVRSTDGELLGSITDIMVSNSDPENALAVINIGSDSDYTERLWFGDSAGLTVVPMTALKVSQGKLSQIEFVLNSTEAILEAAPPFDTTKMDSPQYDVQLYKYYGVEPYWTEECTR